MKKSIIVFCLITVVLLTSCVGSPSWEDIDPYIDPKINSNKILNLAIDPNEKELDIIERTSAIMENNLLDTSTETYGYYYLKLDYKQTHWQNPVGSIPLFSIFGIPMEYAYLDLFIDLFIFDSNGKLIKKIETEDSVTQKSGLILFFPYGTDPSKKMGKAYSLMLEKLFNDVTNESDAINQALRKAGPISSEKEEQAKIAMLEYYESLPDDDRPKFNYSSYNYSITSSTESDTSDPALDTTMDILNTMQDEIEQFDEGMNDYYNNGPYSKCYTCNGTGKCSNCNGTGKLYGANCIVCKGSTSCFACDGDGNIY